ncbi:PREDICTED: ATP-dependent DNA helicase mph1 isoform X2 [Tarenaya hassleriana]|uniref:ATP-dependent DNA helicase mph1 isoform X2 n=1 Tax=Tarenaya hassleriana TaxID=28532 RepID=UPI00053C0D16|nr:PREDICTED: ATP-dependent DNA helicase mph1 isoform X2 [Tarenaya hassleriana]
MGSEVPIEIVEEADEFDWEAAVREIDLACQKNTSNASCSVPHPSSFLSSSSHFVSTTDASVRKNNLGGPAFGSGNKPVATKQSTLDRFIGRTTGIPPPGNRIVSNPQVNEFFVDDDDKNPRVDIDPEAAKTWIYPVNVPHRDYQFSITKTALFSNTLVALPTGLGKTLIAAVVMYNYFRWFPEGKIVFAAPSRPLVMQQIEACHNVVGIPQEWTIDMTGQTSPAKRACLWKNKRVFFVTPQVLEKDIQSGSCHVNYLVCLVIDEAHRASGNYSYCVVVRELMLFNLQLMAVPVKLRILALSATPGSKTQAIQGIIDSLQISTLEYRNESDHDVSPYVHNRKVELIEVPLGRDADEINKRLLDVIRPYAARLSSFGLIQNRDYQTFSPCDLLTARDKFRQAPPTGLPHVNHGDVEACFAALITLYHVRKLLSSHGIRPAYEMLEEKLQQGPFARLMSKNEDIRKAKLLMQQSMSNGAPSPKLSKMLEVLVDHFKMTDPKSSRVIVFSNFRGSVRDIMSALDNIGDVVKATEFIGQSSGKTLKGQSQKVQQAVLEKFRAGGFNVIVATSIGEEGLDIMEVDLVICFDANVSPLRMIQRMGRTGRKHDGRVDILKRFFLSTCHLIYAYVLDHFTILFPVKIMLEHIVMQFLDKPLLVLACEGSEIKAYTRKQANGRSIKKHMRNGGMNSFDFHPSPRMIPHVFKPEVQFVELSIKQFVPRGKKLQEDVGTTSETPAFQKKLTPAETNLLAKYFNQDGGSTRRPSLIAFPHFQALPSKVHNVMHSHRTGMLIDAMQCLQDATFSEQNKSFFTEDEAPLSNKDGFDAALQVGDGTKDLPFFDDSLDNTSQTKAKDPAASPTSTLVTAEKDYEESLPTHQYLFGSECVSVDNLGKVFVMPVPVSLSAYVPCSKCTALTKTGHSGLNASDIDLIMKASQARNLDISHDFKQGESPNWVIPVQEAQILENDLSEDEGRREEIDDDKILILSDKDDFDEEELSPRLTNFIKSGVVPDSPVYDQGATKENNIEEEEELDPPELSSPVGFNSDLAQEPSKSKRRNEEGGESHYTSGSNELKTPQMKKDLASERRNCFMVSPVPGEWRTPLADITSSNASKDWRLSSGEKSEITRQPRKLKRLRKLGDCAATLKENGSGMAEVNHARSRPHTSFRGKKHVGGKKNCLDANVRVFIDEEAEVSSEAEMSADEKDDVADNSYEDSFIDDRTNPTSSTQANSGKVDMMAIYRRSLLSQSPLPRRLFDLPSSSPSPVSVGPLTIINENQSSSDRSLSSLRTPRTNSEPSDINLNMTSKGDDVSGEHDTTATETRKRKFGLHNNTGNVPMINLEDKFASLEHSETVRDNADALENGDDDDDAFYETLDFDAVEAQATLLLKQRSEAEAEAEATVLRSHLRCNDVEKDKPSFDLGFW